MDTQELDRLLEQTFFQYGMHQIERIAREGRSFAHYTSTEAALSIIANKEIRLRNSGVMNDYSEIAHGEACIRYCLFEDQHIASRSKKILDSLREGFFDRAIQWLVKTAPMRRAYTYLLSISEHGPSIVKEGDTDEESQFGRLSMWRAYGNSGGVGLIFRNTPFVEPNGAMPVFTSPVFYGNPDAFAHEYSKMLTFIEQNIDKIKQIDPEDLWENFTRFMHFSILGCKHPGFSEEREWRITYSADPNNEHLDDDEFNQTSSIKREFISINGVPQRIYKIPFIDSQELGVIGITLPDILKQLIIGPTQYPAVVHDALAIALLRVGFAPEKVQIAISQIPLRT